MIISNTSQRLQEVNTLLATCRQDRITFERRCGPACSIRISTTRTGLWREYSAMSNRLDFLPPDSEDYKLLDKDCDQRKSEYDEAHARANHL